jgi:hypothetical protein
VPPGTSAKVIAEGVTATVTDSESVAVSETLAEVEFNWAYAPTVEPSSITPVGNPCRTSRRI